MSDRRWYDKDPILKEALELLRLSSDELKGEAAEFIINMQDQVAGEVINDMYEMLTKYQGKGNRWYDNDPVVMKAVELWRVAPKKLQRKIALKLLLAIEEGDSQIIKLTEE